jgi:hypothetical protein
VCNRKAPNEVSHLWVVAKMLTTLKTDGLLPRLLKYVIAACHLKIQRRFETRRSQEYWDGFKSVQSDDILLSAVQAASRRKRLQIELENDRQFLMIVRKGDIVPGYEKRFPNIAHMIKELPNFMFDKTPPDATAHSTTWAAFELFNDTTCKEYHDLFLDLMVEYKKYVDQIATMAHKGNPFEDSLGHAFVIGHALLTMVKGRAFYLYLSTIALKLSKCRFEGSQIGSDKRNAKTHDSEQGTILWPGDPVEAHTATTAIWKPFKSWVMLILVQLDAADALCAFVKMVELSHAEVDVKLVYSSLIDDKTIPLEVLLTNTDYIPEPVADPKSNGKLLDFIMTANTLKRQTAIVGTFKKQWHPKRSSEAKSIIQNISEETKKDRIDPNPMIDELTSQILELLPRNAGADISAKFTALEEVLKEKQARYKLPFSERPDFKGALHCEAGLASLLDKTTRETIQAQIDKFNTSKKQAGGKNSMKANNEELYYDSLRQLLDNTKVGFFSVRLVPTVNPK